MRIRSRSKLVHLLLSKSMAEALLVTAVAVGFYFSTTNRHLRGVLDRADNQTVTGWVVDEAQPATRVEVQLFIDENSPPLPLAGEFLPAFIANRRPRVDRHALRFQRPPYQSVC